MVMGRSTQVEATGNDDRRDKGRWRCISASGWWKQQCHCGSGEIGGTGIPTAKAFRHGGILLNKGSRGILYAGIMISTGGGVVQTDMISGREER